MKELEKIKSVCPSCYQQGLIEKIDAKIIEENGKVWIIKKCKKHGSFKDIYFNDSKIYKKWMKYKIDGTNSPDVKTKILDSLR